MVQRPGNEEQCSFIQAVCQQQHDRRLESMRRAKTDQERQHAQRAHRGISE